MTGLMNREIGTTTNITTASDLEVLMDICYRGTEMMQDMEQAREERRNPDIMIPRDYMFERDREKLRDIGIENGTRIIGGVAS